MYIANSGQARMKLKMIGPACSVLLPLDTAEGRTKAVPSFKQHFDRCDAQLIPTSPDSGQVRPHLCRFLIFMDNSASNTPRRNPLTQEEAGHLNNNPEP